MTLQGPALAGYLLNFIRGFFGGKDFGAFSWVRNKISCMHPYEAHNKS